jgi:type VI secretion system protein ImpM
MSEALLIERAASAAGWFGKLPALGDFASRRLSAQWLAAWDGWLQHELVRAREALGEDSWQALYMVAPVRRFWLAPGLVTHQAWLGVMMPSVDSVGRQFPFTLTAQLADGHADLVDALADNDWLDAADALARAVLDPAFDVAALERTIPQLAATHGERRLEAHAGTLLAQQLRETHAALRCAWWCEGASRAEQFLCAGELPAEAAFVALWREAS